MTSQTVEKADNRQRRWAFARVSCDVAPWFARCRLLMLGYLLPEGEPSYPSVIDQVPLMIQQKKLNLASLFVVIHRQLQFGIFFPLHCLF